MAQLPPTRQRPSAVLHELLQQSESCAQRSPSARQKVSDAQRPPLPPLGISQKPLQQLLLLLQASPSVVQPLPCVVQVRVEDEQLLSQHCMLEVQLPPACVHCPAVEQRPLAQSSEQQSTARVQLAPGALHSLISMQRLTPAASFSHRPEQQAGEAPGVHTSPRSKHELAAMSHLPPTQLSEQQSVLTAQVSW
jgi:hypothetical protein